MAGPQHGIVGNDFPTELPETEVPDYDISREQSMARFSKSKEYQILRDILKSRIDFHKVYTPGGNGTATAFRDLPNEERGWRTLAADVVIEEFQSVINAYEQANQVVIDAAARRKRT